MTEGSSRAGGGEHRLRRTWSPRRWALVAVLLAAAFLRYWDLPSHPLGIEHDEVAEVLIAESILAGKHALFFTEAYGQEPLFLYLVAVTRALLGRNVLAVRFVSASAGLLTVAACARFAWRAFGERVALVAAVGVGLSFWPVFWSRVGLRGMLLPLAISLGADALWALLQGRHRTRSTLLAGLWFGLSAYTYLAARGVPLVLLGLAVLLSAFDGARLRRHWRALLAAAMLAALIASPLALHLLQNRDAQTRVYEVDAPLQAVKQGDLGPVLANLPRILGMFTYRGDATERNNLPDRPVFVEPVWALLFLVGIAVALSRFRDVRHSLMLTWLGVMLTPSLVTTEAPNFVRTLGALPAVMVILGIGAEWVWQLVQRRRPARTVAMAALLAAVALLNAGLTVRDYFVRWPQVPEVAFVWQRDLNSVATWLDQNGSVRDVTIGGLSASSMDAPSLDLLMQRDDAVVRWCDPGSPLGVGGGVLVPSRGGTLVVPDVVPLSTGIRKHLETELGVQAVVHRGFVTYQLERPSVSGDPVAIYDEEVSLVALDLPSGATSRGQSVAVLTAWAVGAGVPGDIKAYVHLLDQSGEVRAQHDGLDCPSQFWREGDLVIQAHALALPDDLLPGSYGVRIGLYDRQTLQPYPLVSGEPSWLAGAVEVSDG